MSKTVTIQEMISAVVKEETIYELSDEDFDAMKDLADKFDREEFIRDHGTAKSSDSELFGLDETLEIEVLYE